MTSTELCGRLMSRGNAVMIRWTPAQLGVEGNETVDLYAAHALDRAYLRQTSFAHNYDSEGEDRRHKQLDLLGVNRRSVPSMDCPGQP